MTVSTCLHHAVAIHRSAKPKDWPRALLSVPEDCRAECETYLRGIAARLRTLRDVKARRT